MLIDFLSIQKYGAFFFYEIAPRMQQQNCGSFVICSVANDVFKPLSDITGTINGAEISLLANEKSLPYRLQIGNKSMNQLRLWQIGCHLPHTVVLDFSVSEAYKRDGEIDLRFIYNQIIAKRLASAVAIRSSSNLEDSDERSFAGVFDTYLNVPNELDKIQGKIERSYQKFCSGSDRQEEMIPYDVRLSIIVQQMIQPKYSGYLFTLDPMNPPSNWLKIEYWKGPRENSEGYTVTLNQESGKRVRSGRNSNRAPLPLPLQKKLHSSAIEVERYFGTPQDIEFLISETDESLYLVQSRPITAFSYSPDKVRVDEQQKLAVMQEKNRKLYHLGLALSSTNISELFNRAIPLGYSIFKYGFAGTDELEGGISIGRSRLGYARLDPSDGANLFCTVADQARTNLIVDALTFRLPGISRREYLDIFVKHYIDQITINEDAANYPEYGLYLQTDDPEAWLEIAGSRGKDYCTEFTKLLKNIIQTHAPREYRNAGHFFQENDRWYRSYLDRNLHILPPDLLKQEIKDILSYLRTTFCPQYVVYGRLAFLCTHVARIRLSKKIGKDSLFSCEEILNKLLGETTIPPELEGPKYPEFERLFKLARVTLPEFLHRFQHIGSLDITQPRLGEYTIEKLHTIFGQRNPNGLDGYIEYEEYSDRTKIDITEIDYVKDPDFQTIYTNAGQFMRLREKAKFELLKLLWLLKLRYREFARLHRLNDLIYYLELDEAMLLGPENREELRILALQRKAYLETCRYHQVKDVLLGAKSTPFEKKRVLNDKDEEGLYRFARGKAIFHGHAEGFCLKASNNEEFIDKLAAFRTKNIEKMIGVFKGVELSYFNMSSLAGFTTENGGYLSHAATIAREFRLPYITDNRFDQFRDEDYLILDTDNEQVIIRR